MGAIPKADSRQLSARPGGQVPPLIVRVLADEQLYRDGAPTWPGAPTSNNAKKARKGYIKRLKRFSPQLPEAAKLAEILARCKRRRRCASGACPECGRAFQRFFVSEVKDLASNESLLKLTAVSIAFPRHRTADDKLDTLNTTKMKRDVTETAKDFRPHSLDGWRHRPQPQRGHVEKCAQLLAGPVVRLRRSIEPRAILQVAASDIQKNPGSEATHPNRGMRRLISGNLLRIQERFRPAHRLPRASWST